MELDLNAPDGPGGDGPVPGVFVVHRDAERRCQVRAWIEEAGYPTAGAGGVDDAWDALEEGGYAVALVDAGAPTEECVSRILRIRERFGEELAVVLLTSLEARKGAVEAMAFGACGYVIEPPDRSEVLVNVFNALERHRLSSLDAEMRRIREASGDWNGPMPCHEQEVALRLLRAAEYRSIEAGAHIRRVGLASASIGEKLGWERKAIDDLLVAAFMHDIGKIAVPDVILMSTEKLTAREINLFREHTRIGAELLGGSGLPLLELASEIALYHHERWDGSGYPEGLKGEAIPESARIVGLADVYDAMVHERFHRPAVPEQEALAFLADEVGKQFDPKVYDAFLKALPEIRAMRQQVRDHQRPKRQQLKF